MVAVFLPTVSVVPVWVLLAGVVLAAGVTPLASWLLSLSKKPTARRLMVAALVAFVLAFVVQPVGAVICPSCFGCDPWWLEWFWICLP